MGKRSMKEWEKDKRKTDKHLPKIKSILGRYLIGEPPIEEDAERNTDLIVLKMEAVRIGVRLRRPHYATKYPGEFTIRAGRPSGIKTELTKIIEGWGDYFFYGFADIDNPDSTDVMDWTLCNLKVFRYWFQRTCCQNRGKTPGIRKANEDGSSEFIAFRFRDLPPEFIVSQEVGSFEDPNDGGI